MISPELLRRFPLFAHFSEDQLTEVALISEEIALPQDSVIFEECQTAAAMFLLLEGGVELYFVSKEEYHPTARKEFSAGDINPGELFGCSALVEPYVLNASARVTQPARLIKIDAAELRKLLDANPDFGYLVMKQMIKVVMERLASTRVQLAAAWA